MAAVAVVLFDGPKGLELLFVKRRERPGGRWSGHVAFPGGLADAGETRPEETAQREAHEEVGVTLEQPIGRLSAQLTIEPRRARPMRVVPVVFGLRARPTLVCEPAEVAEAFWVPWHDIRRARTRWILRRARRFPIVAPSIPVGGHTLWGLTLQMVWELRRILG